MKFLNSIRFSGDAPAEPEDIDSDNSKLIAHFLYSAVKVQKEAFPRLFSIIEKSFSQINGDMHKCSFFVYPSNEPQASCVRFALKSNPIFLFSSSIIEYMTDSELMFVIGHEYGHYFFKHSDFHAGNDALSTLRKNIQSRSAEISADRMGLIACGDLRSATSVLIKLATGLSEKNVKFNIETFLLQYTDLIKFGPSPMEAMSSHPIFLSRLRGLILFSRSKEYARSKGGEVYNLMDLAEIDKILKRDFSKLSGVSLSEIENNILKRVAKLGAFIVFANDGKISKDEQHFITEYLNDSDFNEPMSILRAKGLEGLCYEFESSYNYVRKTFFPVSSTRALDNFFEILLKTFNSEDTKTLKSILSKYL